MFLQSCAESVVQLIDSIRGTGRGHISSKAKKGTAAAVPPGENGSGLLHADEDVRLQMAFGSNGRRRRSKSVLKARAERLDPESSRRSASRPPGTPLAPGPLARRTPGTCRRELETATMPRGLGSGLHLCPRGRRCSRRSRRWRTWCTRQRWPRRPVRNAVQHAFHEQALPEFGNLRRRRWLRRHCWFAPRFRSRQTLPGPSGRGFRRFLSCQEEQE